MKNQPPNRLENQWGCKPMTMSNATKVKTMA